MINSCQSWTLWATAAVLLAPGLCRAQPSFGVPDVPLEASADAEAVAALVVTARPSDVLRWLPDAIGPWASPELSGWWYVGYNIALGDSVQVPHTNARRCYSDAGGPRLSSSRMANLGLGNRQAFEFCGTFSRPPDSLAPLCVSVLVGVSAPGAVDDMPAWTPPDVDEALADAEVLVFIDHLRLEVQTPAATLSVIGPSSQRARMENLLGLFLQRAPLQARSAELPDGVFAEDGRDLVVTALDSERPYAVRFRRPDGYQPGCYPLEEGLPSSPWVVLTDQNPDACAAGEPIPGGDAIVFRLETVASPVDVLEGAEALRWRLITPGSFHVEDSRFDLTEPPRRLEVDGFVAAAAASITFRLGDRPEQWGRIVSLARQGADTLTLTALTSQRRAAEAERMLDELLRTLTVIDL